MLVAYVWSKIEDSRSVFIYLSWGKARQFGRMDETKRKYKVKRQTVFEISRQMFNEGTQYEAKSIGKYARNDL